MATAEVQTKKFSWNHKSYEETNSVR